MGLLEELKYTDNLQGEELDNALFAIRDKYTSPEDRAIMEQYLNDRYDAIGKELDAIEKTVDFMNLKKDWKKASEKEREEINKQIVVLLDSMTEKDIEVLTDVIQEDFNQIRQQCLDLGTKS